jgi:hypothetical protein
MAKDNSINHGQGSVGVQGLGARHHFEIRQLIIFLDGHTLQCLVKGNYGKIVGVAT